MAAFDPVAAVAGLAQANPAAIQRMISDNGDNTFTVRFPGRSAVTVSAPTDAEIGRYATAEGNGLWLSVLEKAYAEMRNRDDLIGSADAYEHIEGGSVGSAITHLTGHDTTTYTTHLNSGETLRDRIREATRDGRLVGANVKPEYLFFGGNRNEGMPTNHAYTIMGVDDATGEILVRNPWGTGGPNGDGMHRFSPADFDRIFFTVAIEDR